MVGRTMSDFAAVADVLPHDVVTVWLSIPISHDCSGLERRLNHS
jgi:hypothetical protein